MARQTKQQLADIAAAELKAAQQAELRRLRAEKAAATRAANKAALNKMQAPAAKPIALEKPEFDGATEDARRRAEAQAAWDTLLGQFEMPSIKRSIAAFVLGLIAACGMGYLIGTIGGMLIVGAVMLTGWVWLGYVIYALTLIAAFYAGGKVGSAVAGFVNGKHIDAAALKAKNTVVGWFKSKPSITETFTGAFAK